MIIDFEERNLNKFKIILSYICNKLCNNNFKKYLSLDVQIDNQLPGRIFKVNKDQEKVKINISKKIFKNFILLNIIHYQLESYLEIIVKTKKIINALFYIGDKKNLNTLKNKSVIIGCSNDPCDLLVPDPLYIMNKAYLKQLAQVDNTLSFIKSNLSFFAGNMFGTERINILNYQKKNLDIVKAVLLKKKLNSNIKSAYSNVSTEFFSDTKITFEEMYSFLIQIDIDGNSNSWPGFYHKLYSGRPLLKIRSSLGYRQWYYDRLKPDYHYFDVKSDLSNFREKYYQALEEYQTTKVFPGREFISKMNYDEELQIAADKISFYFK